MRTHHMPPWMAMIQAHADQAENALITAGHRGTENVPRDITNSAVETVLGPRPARHRKDQP